MGKNGQTEYRDEAMFLADSYSSLLEEQESLLRRIAGSWEYTEDMAISDLDSLSVSYDGERVQTSNIGNPTERIAMKLAGGYVEKRQRELLAERDACIRELAYIDWKAGVVRTVMNKRLDKTERAVCYLIYARRKTFKEARAILRKKRSVRLYNHDIEATKRKFTELLVKEIGIRAVQENEVPYVSKLIKEMREEEKRG